jgi:hypothetical protein
MFRRSSVSRPHQQEKQSGTVLLRAALTPIRTHVRSLARRKPGVQIPLTSTPNLAGQSVASVEPATLTACCGRAAAARSSHSSAGKPSSDQAARLLGPTLTTQRGRRQLPTDGRCSRASSLSGSATGQPGPIANHFPRRRPSPSRPSAWPSTACASFESQAPTSGRRRAVVDTAGDHAGPRPSSHAAAGPRPARDHFPLDTADVATHGHRTLEAGQWTPGRSDARTGHRSLGQAPWNTGRSHRTLDTGCQTRTRTR